MTGIDTLITQLYREQAKRILAALTRVFGAANIELAEDTLQDAFGKALDNWRASGVPANPVGWLFTTAKNQAIDVIRAQKSKMKFAEDLTHTLESEWSLRSTIELEFEEDKIKDDQLRMIFWCCHEEVKTENQIPVILQLLCGFSIPAIARALFLPEETVKKRLYRTKQQLKKYEFETPAAEKLPAALDTVHTSLYLFFNEGYHCSDEKKNIDIDFCIEALALVRMLVDLPEIANRETLALYALMNFHIARINARVDSENQLVAIDQQDRNLWDKNHIKQAECFLQLAQVNRPDKCGRFFYEAMIAQEHCKAVVFEQTSWQKIVCFYDDLISITHSPIAVINQSIAMAYAGDVVAAIDQVKVLEANKQLQASHLPTATLAHLYAKQGNAEKARSYAVEAAKKGGTRQEHQLMTAQIERLLAQRSSPSA